MSSDMNPSAPPTCDTAPSSTSATMASAPQDSLSASASAYLRTMNIEVDVSQHSSYYRQDFGVELDLELSAVASRPFHDMSTTYMLACLLHVAQSGMDSEFRDTGSFSEATWNGIRKDLERSKELCQDAFESTMSTYHDIRKLGKWIATKWVYGFEVDMDTGAIWTTKERAEAWEGLRMHTVEALRPLARLEEYNRPNPTFKWWTECKALHALMPSTDVPQHTQDWDSDDFDDSDSDSVASQDTPPGPGPALPPTISRLVPATPSTVDGSSHTRRCTQIQPPYGWEPVPGYISTVKDPNSQEGEWHCPVVGCRRHFGGSEVLFTSKSSMKRHWMTYHDRDLREGRLRDGGNGTCTKVDDMVDGAEGDEEEEA